MQEPRTVPAHTLNGLPDDLRLDRAALIEPLAVDVAGQQPIGGAGRIHPKGLHRGLDSFLRIGLIPNILVDPIRHDPANVAESGLLTL